MGPRRVVARSILAASLAATALAGCGLRLETEDPVAPNADAFEILRDAAARAEADVARASSAAADPDSWLAAVAGALASEHLDALGGVYVAFPTPSAGVEPSPSAAPVDGPTSFARYAAFARDVELEGALTSEDPGLALLLGSAGVAHASALATAAWRDARAVGYGAPAAQDRTPPVPGGHFSSLVPSTADQAAAIGPDGLEALILAHDYASYAYEVMAARSSGEARTAYLDRSWLHDHRADRLVALAGADPRAAGYEVDRVDVSSEQGITALAVRLETDIANDYMVQFSAAIAAVAAPEVKAWLLAGAFDALVQANLWELPSPAAVDAFPGIAVADA